MVKEYEAKGYTDAAGDAPIKVQGEDAAVKSEASLYAVEDRTSPLNEPYDISHIRLNCIGGQTWKYQGDWIEWTVDVKEAGLYTLCLRSKQNFNSGMITTRTLSVDGEIPFAEARNIGFHYSGNWQIVTPADSDGNPYKFYFSAGTHTLRLTNTLGELGGLLRQIEESSLVLNTLYRQVRMVVGTSVDAYRDYHLENYIPDIEKTIADQHELFCGYLEQMGAIAGKKGEQTVVLEQLRVQLESFMEKPETIQMRIDDLNGNLSSLSTWMLNISEQMVLIDYIALLPKDAQPLPVDAPWYRKLFNELRAFVLSFVTDYNLIEPLTEQETHSSVTLWLSNGVGRDQASILKHLSESSFTEKHGIQLNIKLVDMGILLRAVADGSGPDVAIFEGKATPMNYGVRSALYDLSQFPDTPEVLSRFHKEAVVPFTFNGKLFALPETQVFPMMFVREDVMAELGVKVPETWDDLYALIPALQRHYLEISLPTPATAASGEGATGLNEVFSSLLFQNNGKIYNEDGSRCILNDTVSVDSFIRWSELYTRYKIPVTTNALSYFRTGQSPIVIANYNFYNSLSVGAPEIRGMWKMYPIPGMKDASGNVHRETCLSVTAAMMFANAADPDASWEFLKWWTDEATQASYGREIEALQGASGRWMTANLKAMESIAWPTQTTNLIKDQMEWVKGVPEVPGGYYVGRSVDNAVKSVINSGKSPRETLLDYVDDINDEIVYKRQEFGLE